MIHTHLIKTGLDWMLLFRALWWGCMQNVTSFEYAIKVFDEMSERDVASWNTVISCYYQDGQAEKAMELFKKMRDSGFEPNSVTLTIVLVVFEAFGFGKREGDP
ncbi:hypothetical protein QYF36_017064 [Acer negundo]|nr:hypothetical protein QYF36_017064 [Acer negundo]